MRKLMPIAVVALVLAGCGSDEESSAPASGSSGSAAGTKTVSLEDNSFSPKTISGDPGSTVKLKLTNTGQAEHTFTVDSQKIDTELESGDSAEVSVTIPTTGSVEFYCRYHKSSGMVGTLGSGKSSGTTSETQGKGSYY